MPLSEDGPTPLQLRAELEEMVLKDLLGPAGSAGEITEGEPIQYADVYES